MSTDFLPPPLDADALTGILRRAGVLGAGRVAAIDVTGARPTVLSRVARLVLTYEGGASDAPPSLVLKTGLPGRAERGWDGAKHEVAFYALVAPALAGRLVPRCFDAHADEATTAWHLVLEDLTETHRRPSVWPLPPDDDA